MSPQRPLRGTDGYIYFSVDGNGGASGDLSALPGFASVDTTGDSRYSDSSYSSMTIAGTLHHTGVVYQGEHSQRNFGANHFRKRSAGEFRVRPVGQ